MFDWVTLFMTVYPTLLHCYVFVTNGEKILISENTFLLLKTVLFVKIFFFLKKIVNRNSVSVAITETEYSAETETEYSAEYSAETLFGRPLISIILNGF